MSGHLDEATLTARPTDIINRMSTRAALAGAVGGAVMAAGFFVQRETFFQSYLIGYMYWMYLTLGSLGLLMVQHLSGGAWGIVSRRVPDHEQGAMLGTTQAISALTRIAGPLWAGLSFDWLGPGAPYWTGAMLILAAASLVARDATAGR